MVLTDRVSTSIQFDNASVTFHGHPGRTLVAASDGFCSFVRVRVRRRRRRRRRHLSTTSVDWWRGLLHDAHTTWLLDAAAAADDDDDVTAARERPVFKLVCRPSTVATRRRRLALPRASQSHQRRWLRPAATRRSCVVKARPVINPISLGSIRAERQAETRRSATACCSLDTSTCGAWSRRNQRAPTWRY